MPVSSFNAGLFCLFRKFFGIIQRKYRLADLVRVKLRRLVCRGKAQNENRLGDAALPQMHRLFDIGNGKPVRSFPLKHLGYLLVAMAISVSLDDCHDFAFRPDFPTNLPKVMRQRVQPDLRPGPFEKIHLFTLFLSERRLPAVEPG